MDKQAENTENKKENGGKHLDVNAAINLAAYPISGAAGYYAFKQDVRKNSVEFHTKGGEFDKITGKMLDQIKEARANKGKPYGANMQEAMAYIREKYEEAKSHKFQSMGYKSVLDNWKDIADNNKMEAITAGFTVAFISLGAMLTIANRKEIFKPLFKKDGEDKELEK